MSEFDHTDILKRDGDLFLKCCFPFSLHNTIIQMEINAIKLHI